MSIIIWSCDVLQCPKLYGPVMSCNVQTYMVLWCPAMSKLIWSCDVLQCPELYGPVMSCNVQKYLQGQEYPVIEAQRYYLSCSVHDYSKLCKIQTILRFLTCYLTPIQTVKKTEWSSTGWRVVSGLNPSTCPTNKIAKMSYKNTPKSADLTLVGILGLFSEWWQPTFRQNDSYHSKQNV